MSDQPPVAYPRPTGNFDAETLRMAATAFKASSLATLAYLVVVAVLMTGSGLRNVPLVLIGCALVIVFIVLAVRASIAVARALQSSVPLAVLLTLLVVCIPCGVC